MSGKTLLYNDEETASQLGPAGISMNENLGSASNLDEFVECQSRRSPSRFRKLLTRAHMIFVAMIESSLAWKGWSQFFTPSFLVKGNDEPMGRGGPSGALDGLRGIACFIVATYHFLGQFYDVDHGYIWNHELPDGGQFATWLNLPIVKAFHNGPNMVGVFFVISGYVLSHRFIYFAQHGEVDKAVDMMPAAIFKRWMRLFTPVGISFMIISFLLWCGLYENARTEHNRFMMARGRALDPFLLREDTAWKQMVMCFQTWRHVIHSFTWQRYGPVHLNPNAWTISIEYRCSIVVFVAVIALAKVKSLLLRLSFLVLLMAWALQWEQRAWEVVLFIGGTFVAEINVAVAIKNERSQNTAVSSPWWIAILVFGLYCASVPGHHLYDADPGLGWHLLRDIAFIPASYTFNTYQFIGAVCLVAVTTNWDPLQRLLNSSVPQYFGQLSYALYLVHGPMYKLLCWTLVPHLWDIMHCDRKKWDTKSDLSVGLGYIVFIASTIYLSDLFMRYVDIPSVKFSKWIWAYCTS